MTMEQDGTVGFGKHQINPWNKVVDFLYENFDDDDLEEIKIRIPQIYKLEVEREDEEEEEDDQMLDDRTKFQKQFVDLIDKHDDKLQCARELLDCLKVPQLHTDRGESLYDIIESVIRQLKEFEERHQELFVGREETVADIVQQITSGLEIGVAISALAGQGKSAVARQVCNKLELDNWIVYRADLRDSVTIQRACSTFLQACSNLIPSSDEAQLRQDLKSIIQSRTKDTLYLLDNCEEGLNYDQLLSPLFQTAAKSHHKVRFLLTGRTKIKPGRNKTFFKQLEQRVLGPMEEDEATELLKKEAGNDDIDEVAGEIVRECACSPLAVIMAGKILKSGKLAPENLVVHLKLDQRNVTEALMVRNCIDTTINSLGKDLQTRLVCLSVFQSGTFNHKSAEVIFSDSPETKQILNTLLEYHLIEEHRQIDRNMNTEDGKMLEESERTYSLQPLVYRYIKELKKSQQLEDALCKANSLFVELYEMKINKIVKYYDTKCLKGIKMLEKNRTHIMRFYDLLETDETLKLYKAKVKSQKFVLSKKRVSDLADILLSDAKKRRLFQKEATRAKAVNNDAMYAFWMVEEADVLVTLHDKAGLAEEKLDSLTNGTFPSLRGLHRDKFYPAIVHALFHKVKGLVRCKQQDFSAAEDHLNLAIHFYETCTSSSYNHLKSRVYCKLGEVCIQQQKYDRAEEVLVKGFQLISTRSQDGDNMSEDVPEVSDINKVIAWDAPKFHELFGRIQLAKARQEDCHSQQRQKHLDQAQQHFQKGMRLDVMLKMEQLDGYCEKQYGLAEVYIEKGQFSEACKHAEASCDKRRMILQPPHITFTLAVYQMALVFQLLGNDFQEKGDKGSKEHAHDNWITSRDYYSELEDHHLINGGISTDHSMFAQIKQNHFKLAAQLGDNQFLKKITKLYKDIEAGRYKSKEKSFLESFKAMAYTPMEVLKNMFGSGGNEFGQQESVLQRYQGAADEQFDRMMGGEPAGDRHDSGRGHSSDLGESFSSGSGSISSAIGRLQLQQSVSFEDNVFQEETFKEESADLKPKHDRKRVKTERK